ncbi:elongation factor Tu [endosymbiont GvMRE of Glomus versiforme]|uniref:elongation factor Tu n=1 Tax=endosymbiont GvMRE of Glomus versiforme TaxID=2039283 RepID=UPI000ECEF00F|nr:elongation factor Tu [endosymbiont GvMRE of Glomus versiforme]RHZ35593.1 Elongation factor Tu [endosymbiont GvMRE of Glomus versiforme]
MAENIVRGKKFDRSKPHISIGGVGHVDHGKTTLIAAITKHLAKEKLAQFKDYNEIDKAPEEKERGITINTSHVEFETSKRHYTWIDCPGHKDYIKNMISGAAQMDGAILVVSAEDGAMPQTKEHLLLAKQMGIKYMVVFINKVDVVLDLEQIKFAEEEIKEEIKKHGYDAENTPIIAGSALCALEERNPELGEKSIIDLLNAIDNYIPDIQRDETSIFRMPIEEIFTISGRGTVVSGKVKQGVLKKGDEVEVIGLKGDAIRTIAVSIEMYHKELEEARAGDDVGINLRGVKKESLKRGQILKKVIGKKEGTKIYKKFFAHAYVLSEEEKGRHSNFKSGYRPQFYFNTADITGTIVLENKDEEAKPGSRVEFTVELIKPMAIESGDNFIMREGGRTVGTGSVTKVIE